MDEKGVGYETNLGRANFAQHRHHHHDQQSGVVIGKVLADGFGSDDGNGIRRR